MQTGIANQRFPLKSAAGENVHGIPGACATHNFTDLVRGPWNSILRSQSHYIPGINHTVRICCVYCGLSQVDFTHILQGCFTGTGGHHTMAPVPVKRPWRIWENKANGSTQSWLHDNKKTKHKYVCITRGVYCSWFGGVVGPAPLCNVDRRIIILSFQSKHYKIDFMEMSHAQSNISIFSILHPPIFCRLYSVLFNPNFPTWLLLIWSSTGPNISEACQKSILVLTWILSRHVLLAIHGLEHSNILSRKISRHIDVISSF